MQNLQDFLISWFNDPTEAKKEENISQTPSWMGLDISEREYSKSTYGASWLPNSTDLYLDFNILIKKT